MTKLEQHHVKYKEIHGIDAIVMLTQSAHRQLHARLRREGKCNIPVDELDKISKAAHTRSPLGRVSNKKFRQSDRGKLMAKRSKQSESGRGMQKRYRQSRVGKAAQIRASQSDASKKAHQKYGQSEKGKAVNRVASAKYYQKQKEMKA